MGRLDSCCFLVYSGDGTLSVLNIRRKRFEARSENQENELLSLAKVKVTESTYLILAKLLRNRDTRISNAHTKPVNSPRNSRKIPQFRPVSP